MIQQLIAACGVFVAILAFALALYKAKTDKKIKKLFIALLFIAIIVLAYALTQKPEDTNPSPINESYLRLNLEKENVMNWDYFKDPTTYCEKGYGRLFVFTISNPTNRLAIVKRIFLDVERIDKDVFGEPEGQFQEYKYELSLSPFKKGIYEIKSNFKYGTSDVDKLSLNIRTEEFGYNYSFRICIEWYDSNDGKIRITKSNLLRAKFPMNHAPYCIKGRNLVYAAGNTTLIISPSSRNNSNLTVASIYSNVKSRGDQSHALLFIPALDKTFIVDSEGILNATTGPQTIEKDPIKYVEAQSNPITINRVLLLDNTTINWNNRGTSAIKQGKYAEAVEDFDKAIQLNPNFPEGWINKGTALYYQGKFDEAIQSFDKAIQLNSGDAVAWNNKGSALDDLGKANEAIQSFDKAIQLNPNYAEAWYNMGVTLTRIGRTTEAKAAHAKAKELGYNE